MYTVLRWEPNAGYEKYLFPYKRTSSDKEIIIQVGNSATNTNNHIDVLKTLEKYKCENIKIFLPLAYGEQEYAEEVIAYLETRFLHKERSWK